MKPLSKTRAVRDLRRSIERGEVSIKFGDTVISKETLAAEKEKRMSTQTHEGEEGKTRPDARLSGPMTFSQDQKKKLREFVASAEQIESELKDINESKSDLYEEIEEAGFDKKMVKRVVKARKMSAAEREYDQETFDFYMEAVGDAD